MIVEHHSGTKLSRELEALRKTAAKGPLTLAEILEQLGERAYPTLLLLVTLPFLQPIPLPGLSTISGLVVVLIGSILVTGRKLWLPQKARAFTFSPEFLQKFCERAAKFLKFLEKLVRPRFPLMIELRISRIMTGICVVIAGVLFALPLPIPASNAVPAVTIALFALGLMEEDGVVVGLGYLGTLVTLAFFSALVVLPWLGYRGLTHGD